MRETPLPRTPDLMRTWRHKPESASSVLIFFRFDFRNTIRFSCALGDRTPIKIRYPSAESIQMQTSDIWKSKGFHAAISFLACLIASGTISLTVVSWSQPLPPGRNKLGLPVEFSNYKEWTPLHSSPYAVPL